MDTQSSDKTATPIEPLLDTWGGKKSAGKWFISPPFDFTSLSIEEVNVWYINSTIETIDAFSKLARVWRVFFSPSPKSDIKGVVLEWQPGKFYEEYIENVLKAIREYPAAIEELAMQVDLFVYVRTPESPQQPIQAWVRNLGELVIRGDPEFGEPYLCFSVHHTLFYPFSYHNGNIDNSELYSLNQPLLEKALRNWEERLGPICEVEGLPGIYQYGFLPEE